MENRTEVILTKDLTRYADGLLKGSKGYIIGKYGIWSRNNDCFTGVCFPGIATLDILWRDIEIINESHKEKHKAEPFDCSGNQVNFHKDSEMYKKLKKYGRPIMKEITFLYGFTNVLENRESSQIYADIYYPTRENEEYIQCTIWFDYFKPKYYNYTNNLKTKRNRCIKEAEKLYNSLISQDILIDDFVNQLRHGFHDFKYYVEDPEFYDELEEKYNNHKKSYADFLKSLKQGDKVMCKANKCTVNDSISTVAEVTNDGFIILEDKSKYREDGLMCTDNGYLVLPMSNSSPDMQKDIRYLKRLYPINKNQY